VVTGPGSSCYRTLSRTHRCLNPFHAPSPDPAHRTGRADLPHPALRQVSRDDPRPKHFVRAANPARLVAFAIASSFLGSLPTQLGLQALANALASVSLENTLK
jgi:hypothetical protein